MKKRDKYGRFIEEEAAKTALNFWNIAVIIYKLIPALLIMIFLYKYLRISENLSNFFLELVCGSSECSCTCPNVKPNGKINNSL